MAIAKRLAEQDKSNPDWQRDLSVKALLNAAVTDCSRDPPSVALSLKVERPKSVAFS
jgi:hypothetical protein